MLTYGNMQIKKRCSNGPILKFVRLIDPGCVNTGFHYMKASLFLCSLLEFRFIGIVSCVAMSFTIGNGIKLVVHP